MLYGKEQLCHAHVQRLSEASRPCYQRHAVPALPPLGKERGLIDIKVSVFPNRLKILTANSNRPGHSAPPYPFHNRYPQNSTVPS